MNSKVNNPDDPWSLVDPPKVGKDWQEKSHKERLLTVVVVTLKLLALLCMLYLFICSLDFLSNAFRLLGGKAAGEAFRTNSILSNPIANLMIGILATVLLQSSSTTTSIVVTMVAADIVQVRPAIFMIMGANIGTSVTNTIVSMGHASQRDEFRRAFAGATVHDMFNWLAVICLLPIEWLSGSFGSWKGCGLLCQFTKVLVEKLEPTGNADTKKDLLKVITKPFTKLIIQLDKKVLSEYVTMNSSELAGFSKSLIKHKCTVTKTLLVNVTDSITNETTLEMQEVEGKDTCVFMFEYISRTWSDATVGACVLAIALTTLCVCLVLIVKLLHSLLRGKMAILLRKFINSDFPGCFKYFTGYVAILLGAGMTMLVQSSSIFTSAMTPLVGVGVLHLERMYPLTLGSNIGTTFTAILAALASDTDKLYITMQVALCHFFFNVFGILIWYPIPHLRKIPISLAKKLGNTTAKYRWFAIVYLILMFLLFPAAVFGLSIAGPYVLLGVGLPILVFFITVVIINILQRKAPSKLPLTLRTWNFLPKALHSLEPYDRIFSVFICACCKKKSDVESCSDINLEINDSLPEKTPEGLDNPNFAEHDEQERL